MKRLTLAQREALESISRGGLPRHESAAMALADLLGAGLITPTGIRSRWRLTRRGAEVLDAERRKAVN